MSTEKAGSGQMLRARTFKLDARRIVHETIDGETILIDLDSGVYYSLTGSGPQVWNLLVAGASDLDVVRELQRCHDAEPDIVATQTMALIDELKDETLLEECEPQALTVPVPVTVGTAPVGRPFEAPVLERYSDMKYFLMLDPIHEVQEAGWPHAAMPGTAQAAPG